MNEELLCKHFGIVEFEKAGVRRAKKRTSDKLGKKVMSEYLKWVYQFGAELGLRLPDPGEEYVPEQPS